MQSLGLYIHIPFCLKKCSYCDFYSVCGNEDIYDEYITDLLSNLDNYNDLLRSRVIDTVYFGGGTPSSLGTDRIAKILEYIDNSYGIAADAEITMELNPITTELLDLTVLRKYGLNRLSVGMQSNNDDELRLLSRLHSSYQTHTTVDTIIKSGIDNFSLDVMLGIPLQTPESLSDTLRFCTDSGAAHISTYMLKIEKGTPFYYNKDGLTFADDDSVADLYELTNEILRAGGYRHYEISNFCKDDRISRHNMKYWRLEDYLGLGPSAHSMIGTKRFYYPRSLEKFRLGETLFESVAKTPEEYIMLTLRTDIGLLYDEYNKLFGTPLPPSVIKKARLYEKEGFVEITNNRIHLSEKGFLVSNSIICELLG